MKNKRVTAILLSAVMALSSFMPMSSMSAFAAENAAVESTEDEAEVAIETESPEKPEVQEESDPAGEDLAAEESSDLTDEAEAEEGEAREPGADDVSPDDQENIEIEDITGVDSEEDAAETHSTEKTTDQTIEDVFETDENIEESTEQADNNKPALAGDLIASGACGDNVTFKLTGTDSNRTLTISGHGELDAYYNSDKKVWPVENLTTVIVEDGVTCIGRDAFSYCENLTSITIPDSVTSIERFAFSSCRNLTSITIPDSVTYVGASAFLYCFGLTNITIPSSVTSWGEYAFSYCTHLASITLQDGVTSIGKGAFHNCTALRNVTIPDSVETIGDSAFFGCSGLTSITIPDSVKLIDYRAFFNCSSLTGIMIPENTASIGEGAFSGCSSLANITIQDGVKSIGRDAFSGCSSLTNITIPGSVERIGNSAFSSCSSLANITIQDGVKSIGSDAFSGCSGLTSITIPETMERIGDSAFFGCSGLTSITIPGGVKDIEKSVFSGCSGLTSITIPDSVTVIEEHAFGGCSGLTSITIPDGVKSIGRSAFGGCIGLTNITIPSSVTSIGDNAFNNCKSLTSIAIPDHVKSISNGTFELCKSLTSITIPDGMTNIGEYAFRNCTSLTSITIPNSVTSIKCLAFCDCSNLTSITIPDSVTGIERDTFYRCSGLTSITIPDSVKYIRDHAFTGCDKLSDLYYAGTKEEWDAIGGSSFVYDMNCILHTKDEVSDEVKAQNIALNKSSATIVTGKSLQLNAAVTPADATYGTVIWDSGNTNVATVNSSGIVTAVSAGTVTITASIEDGALKATCEIEVINPYTIKFNKNATKATLSTASKKVNPGSAVGTLPTPKYTGYYFLGWYTAKTGGTKVTAKTKPSKSVTLYAHWVKRVSINKAVVKVASCTYNGKAQSPAVTVTLGKTKLKKDTDYILTYSGSRTNVNGKAYVTITGKNRYTGSVKKQFTVKPLPITSSAVNLKLKTTSFNYDGKAKKPGFTATSVLNSISRALSIGKDFKVTYSLNIKIGTAEVTFTGIGNYSGTKKLKFKIVAKKTATITFDAGSNGYFASGAPKKVKIVSNEVLGTVPKVIAKHGYKFLGWYDKKNGGLITKNTLFPYSEIVNRTAVAKYQKIVYTVTFKAREEDKERFPYQLPATIKYTVDKASSVVLPKLKAEGCTFHGWQNIVTTKDGKTTIKNVTSLAGVATNVVLYANYEPHMYTIEYQASEGGAVSNTSYTYCAIDKKIKLPKAVFTAPEGKTFDKWKCIETNTLYGDEEEIPRLTTESGKVFHFVALWRDITWRERMSTFITLEPYKDGARWGTDNKPLISKADCGQCRAYAADFVAYVYGFKDKKSDEAKNNYDSYSDDSSGWVYDISKIRAGDVVCDQPGNNHLFVVLESKTQNLIQINDCPLRGVA